MHNHNHTDQNYVGISSGLGPVTIGLGMSSGVVSINSMDWKWQKKVKKWLKEFQTQLITAAILRKTTLHNYFIYDKYIKNNDYHDYYFYMPLI